MSKPPPKASPSALSAWPPWLPPKVIIVTAIGLVALIGLPWLLDSGSPTPPLASTAKKGATDKNTSQSQLGRILSPAHSSWNKPTAPPPAPPSPGSSTKNTAANATSKLGSTPSAFLSLQPATSATEPDSPDAEPKYQYPLTAPNGAPWPEDSDYVDGYDQEATGGLSTVTVDNSRNGNDVFVKLTAIQGNTAQPVRYCYIKAFSQFTFSEVLAGGYDIRFKNLSTGEVSATAPFTLRESPTPNGVRYSNYSVTLYNVSNGNMKLRTLNDNQF